MGAALALGSIFGTSYRRLILLSGLAIFAGSMLFRSYMQQIWFGFEYNLKYHFPVFEVVIPLLLLIVMRIRRKGKQSPIGGVRHGSSQDVADEEAPAESS